MTHKKSPPQTPLTKEQIEEQQIKTWVDEKIASMSAEEKIGQSLMWHLDEKELSSQSAQILTDIPFGGVIIMGNHTKESLKKLTDQIKNIPSKVPRFIAIDQEGGTVKRLMDDPHPGAKALAEKTDDQLCEAYRNTTKLLMDAGINMNFGIVADTGWYENGFISPRTFGKGPESVARFVKLAVECSKAPGFFVTLKHFPGHGRTKFDSHKTIPIIKTPYNEWKTTDALPFQSGIDAGADVVMLGHLTYEQIATDPASISERWTTELRDMGFTGLIITDDMGMMEKSGTAMKNNLKESLFAGAHLILLVSTKQHVLDLFTYVKQEVHTEKLSNQLRNLLQTKYNLKH